MFSTQRIIHMGSGCTILIKRKNEKFLDQNKPANLANVGICTGICTAENLSGHAIGMQIVCSTSMKEKLTVNLT